MTISRVDFWSSIIELVTRSSNLRIPALEDGLFANLLIFDYLYYILLYEMFSFNSLVSPLYTHRRTHRRAVVAVVVAVAVAAVVVAVVAAVAVVTAAAAPHPHRTPHPMRSLIRTNAH